LRVAAIRCIASRRLWLTGGLGCAINCTCIDDSGPTLECWGASRERNRPLALSGHVSSISDHRSSAKFEHIPLSRNCSIACSTDKHLLLALALYVARDIQVVVVGVDYHNSDCVVFASSVKQIGSFLLTSQARGSRQDLFFLTKPKFQTLGVALCKRPRYSPAKTQK
jgi:hypothetical protein